MSEETKLAAKTRDLKNKNVNALRDQGFIPANLYGLGISNQSLMVKKLDFEQAFRKVGESSLIDLVVDEGKPVKVIVKEVQQNPIKRTFIHVDLYQVDMSKKITTEIPLNFTGEASAVKELGGILVKKADHIMVECLPGDLVEEIRVDLSSLNTFDDHVKIGDLNLPSSMKFTGQSNEIVVSVLKPKEEKEEEVVEEVAAEGEEENEDEKEAGKEEVGKKEGGKEEKK